MKNYELNNYRSKPVCDMHIHPHVELPLDETIKIFENIKDYFNYEKIALQSLPYHDIANNFKTLYLKSKIDGIYANLGLIHNLDDRDTQDYYSKQVKSMYRMGCDGFKMLEGKPTYRKQMGRPLNDSVFDKFYEFAEEKQLPIVLHYGDPVEFWDINKIPKWALERGNLYDDSFVSFRNGQKEIEGILEKFPKLKLILAHFFFVSDDIDYAEWFMSKWENVCFDLTPGSEMYFNFSDRIDDWRRFFVKYSDRILYGTDIYNWQQGDLSMEKKYSHAVNLVRGFLERKEPFLNTWQNKEMKNPFGFEDDVLDKIYHDNFIRVFGEKSRELDKEYIANECANFLSAHEFNELEVSNMKQIIDWFKSE
ncbi:MAG: amidohydrolase family protein [Clostridia bacterium]|nr:amidohydrolase family protein [Clostridia bacterium]